MSVFRSFRFPVLDVRKSRISIFEFRFLLLIALCALPTISFAQSSTPDEKFWMTDGQIGTIVQNGDIIYVGGTFKNIGPYTGFGAAIDTSTGSSDTAFPKVNGPITAIAPDGSGGWYIGGWFTSVNGIARNNIAHIKADKTLDLAWNPNANSTVETIAVSGSNIFAGGSFSSIGGQTRFRLAALDATNGNAIDWNPRVEGIKVDTITISGSIVYVGGYFTSIGGQNRNNIAAIDTTSGIVTAWNPNANNTVTSIAVSGATVFAGGEFTSIGGQTRNRIAAIEIDTGNVTTWNPDSNSSVYALAISGSTVYAGGYFTSIGGQPRNHIAAIDATTGSVTFWDPNANYEVNTLAVSGSTVYAGGFFSSIGGQLRNHIAAIDATTGTSNAWNPNASYKVSSLAVSGSTIFAGGIFLSIGRHARNYIAAIDSNSGNVTEWDPSPNGIVESLAVSGSTIYVGGGFSSFGGESRNNLAAIDAATGNVIAWNPNASSGVLSLIISGSTVYAGGEFTTIGGKLRRYIAAIDATTGNVNSWNPNASMYVHTLAAYGSTVYVGGEFTTIGGQARYGLAALDANTGAATAWNPNPQNTVYSLAISGSTIYAGGHFTSIEGQTRNHIAAFDADTGNIISWNPNANSAVYNLAVSSSAVYAGGCFGSIGGQAKDDIAALDIVTGNANTWNPTIYSGGIDSFFISPDENSILVGGSFYNHNYCSAYAIARFSKMPQTITFATLPTKTFGDPSFLLTATTSSGLPISYISSNTAVATITDSTVTIVGAGTTDITTSQAGNSDYLPASNVTQTLTVNKASQTITFAPLPTKPLAGAPFELTATTSSGLPVSYASSDETAATISGSTVTIVGVGTTTITASQAGNTNYLAAPDVQQVLTIRALGQTITFNPLTNKSIIEAPFELTATASSGLPVNYVSSDTAVATISGSTVTIVGLGATIITASQAGNTDYAEASIVQQTLTVNKASQAITFNALPDKIYGDADFAPGAAASSGLTVSYASSNSSVATIVSGNIHIVGAGTTTITASQAGNSNYNAALSVQQALTVNKVVVTIILSNLSHTYNGSPKSATVTTTPPGKAVALTYDGSPTAPTDAGSYAVVGTISEANYEGSASDTLTISKVSQTITFGPLPKKQYGDADFELRAFVSSGLPISYDSSNLSVAAISAGKIHITGPGTSTITASQPGNSNFIPATDIQQQFTVISHRTNHLAVCGKNNYGQIGDGTKTYRSFFITIPGISEVREAAVSYSHTVAVKADGTVWTWGANLYGQLGNGTTTDRLFPVQVSGLSGVVSVAAGESVTSEGKGFTVVLKADGTVWAWGANWTGQLGDGTSIDRHSPVQVSILSDVKAIAVGDYHSVALKADGTVWTWGGGGNGQLGDGTINSRLTPAQVPNLSGVAAVSAKFCHSLALKSDGSMWAWGYNYYGQLGDGTTTIRNFPVQVIGLSSVAAIAAGFSHTIAIKSDGTAWTWGDNYFGQLGDGTTSSHYSPTQVTSLSNVTSISAGMWHAMAVKSDGTVWGWGYNNYGQLGDGTTTNRLSPIHAPIFSGAYTAGGNHSLAIFYPNLVTFLSAPNGTITGTTTQSVDHGASCSAITAVPNDSCRFTGWSGDHIGTENPLTVTNVTADMTITANFAPKLDQTITFDALPAKTYGDADFAPGATVSSGLAVTYFSTDCSVATIVSGNIHIVGAGTSTITASQAGNGNYNGATSVQQTLTVNNSIQTITFNALAVKTYGGSPFTLTATASSGLVVIYSSSNTSVATVSGSTVTITGAGSTVITASHPGNANYNAAADVQQTLTVNKVAQTITFSALPSKTYGDADFDAGATTSSALVASYASSNPSVATIANSKIHIVGAGTTTITASQDGNGNYCAASSVQQTLIINKANQTITFPALADRGLADGDFDPGASVNSVLVISYASSNPAVATIVSGKIHIVGTGTTAISASQAGNGNYAAAADVQRTLTVLKSAQTITFPELPVKAYGDVDFAPGATSSSTLQMSYASSNPAVATIVSGKIHIVGAGATTITASQAGNGNYTTAADVQRTLTVLKSAQTITFPELPAKAYGDADFYPGATASSTLAVSYASSNPAVAMPVNGKIHIVGAGVTTITALQAGNGNYNAAADVQRTLMVAKASQTITFRELPVKAYGDADFAPGASASSGLPVAYASSNPSTCVVVGDKLHIVGAGSTIITASQAGDAARLPAVDVQQALTVAKASQTIAFPELSSKVLGAADFDPGAVASSGLVISYASWDQAVATVVDGRIHLVGIGATAITASQSGDRNYAAAVSVQRPLRVGRPALTACFAAGPHGTVAGEVSQVVPDGGDCSAVTAVPDKGFMFAEWSGDIHSTDNPLTLKGVTRNMTVTANFAVETFQLEVVNGVGGGAYAAGTVVPISANTPEPGTRFKEWTGAAQFVADPKSATTTLRMPSAAVRVTATYTDGAATYALTVQGGAGSGSYPAGTVVPISADAPADGMLFNAWSGLLVADPSSPSTTLVMPSKAGAVTASYRAASDTTYNLIVAGGSGGGDYAAGTVVTIAADPAPSGQTFDAWTGADVAKAKSAVTTLAMPSSDVIATATYKDATTFTLTVVNGSGSGRYGTGESVAIEADAPPEGMLFNAWSGAAVANPASAATTLAMPAVDTTVTATYRQADAATYVLIVENGVGSGSYEAGTKVAVSADPAPDGQMFKGWTGSAAVEDAASAETTLTMPAADTTVAATFEAVEFGCAVKFTSSRKENAKGIKDSYSVTAKMTFPTGSWLPPTKLMTADVPVHFELGDWFFDGVVGDDQKGRLGPKSGSVTLKAENGDVVKLTWDAKKLNISVRSAQPLNSGENILDLDGGNGVVEGVIEDCVISLDDLAWSGVVRWSGKAKIDKKGYQSWTVKGVSR